jgi:hypothetical protein
VRNPCSHPHLIKITFNPLMKHQPVLALLIMNLIGKNVAKLKKIKFGFCHANVRKKFMRRQRRDISCQFLPPGGSIGPIYVLKLLFSEK